MQRAWFFVPFVVSFGCAQAPLFAEYSERAQRQCPNPASCDADRARATVMCFDQARADGVQATTRIDEVVFFTRPDGGVIVFQQTDAGATVLREWCEGLELRSLDAGCVAVGLRDCAAQAL